MAKSKRKSNKSRKEKVEEKKEYEEQIEFTNNIGNKVIIALTTLCILGLFYSLAVYVTNKHSKDEESNKKETTETSETTTGSSISYDEILLGRSLSMSDDSYLVVFYDTTNEEINTTYSEIINNYKAKESHLPIYYVDMGNSFNKSHVKDEANYNPNDESELAITGPTLIKVESSKVVDYIEGEEEIKGYLE